MAYVLIAPNAEQVLREEVSDPWLLQSFLAHFNEIAESPTRHTEPAVSPPYPSNRLMTNFRLEDSEGRIWTFVALLRRMPDEEGIYITSLNVGPPPEEIPF